MESAGDSPSNATKVLSVFSLATFWLLPFSPFIVMAAVSRTQKLNGWVRRLSVAAAILCIAYTVGLASGLTMLYVGLLRG